MASVVAGILDSIVGTLRTSEKFRLVTLGEIALSTDIPRAAVIYEGQDWFRPDDSTASRWGRVRASVTIHIRSTDDSQAVRRTCELCEEAMGSLLIDTFRGGLCHDLPIGRATEVGRSHLVRGLKRPEVEMSFDIRCHFEMTEGS